MLRQVPLCILAACLAVPAAAATDDTRLTIYSRIAAGAVPQGLLRPGESGSGSVPGFAVVLEHRQLDTRSGDGLYRISNLPPLIDPSTIVVVFPGQPELRIRQQDFRHDLGSRGNLLQRHIGRTVRIEQLRGDRVDTVEGRLLSVGDGILLERADGSITSLTAIHAIHFPDPDGALYRSPTMRLELDRQPEPGAPARITYQTGGLTWWTDYDLDWRDADGECRMDFSGRAAIVNRSGRDYRGVRVDLLAGDVHRVSGPPDERMLARTMAMEMDAAEGVPAESVFEYHRYRLPRPVTLETHALSRVGLVAPVTEHECQRELVFDATRGLGHYGRVQTQAGFGANQSGDVAAFIAFENSEQAGLGLPLPAGRVRVSELESDGARLFLGEDAIGHTAKDAEVRIRVGNAFDVRGERRRMDFRHDDRGRQIQESFEIELSNARDNDVEVIVLESLYRAANWAIVASNFEYEKLDANRIRFTVPVAAGERSTLEYTVQYTW